MPNQSDSKVRRLFFRRGRRGDGRNHRRSARMRFRSVLIAYCCSQEIARLVRESPDKVSRVDEEDVEKKSSDSLFPNLDYGMNELRKVQSISKTDFGMKELKKIQSFQSNAFPDKQEFLEGTGQLAMRRSMQVPATEELRVQNNGSKSSEKHHTSAQFMTGCLHLLKLSASADAVQDSPAEIEMEQKRSSFDWLDLNISLSDHL